MSLSRFYAPARRAQLSFSALHNHQLTPRRTYAGKRLGYPQQIEPFTVWPFAAILAAGTCLYVFMVKSRASAIDQKPRNKNVSSSSTPS